VFNRAAVQVTAVCKQGQQCMIGKILFRNKLMNTIDEDLAVELLQDSST